MIKLCIFDLDGTLTNTITTINHYLNVALSANGISSVTEEESKYLVGNGAKLLIKRALIAKGAYNDAVFEKVYKDYNEAYNKEPLYLTEVYSGIKELLCELKMRGVKLAVLSNKPDYPVKNVIKHFFDGFFDCVRGGIEGVPLKPDKTACEKILAELGLTRDECAFIGDTSVDIETGKNLGAKTTVGVLWGFRTREELENAGADIIVSHPSEIISEVFEK